MNTILDKKGQQLVAGDEFRSTGYWSPHFPKSIAGFVGVVVGFTRKGVKYKCQHVQRTVPAEIFTRCVEALINLKV
jgi:hypothetical protein